MTIKDAFLAHYNSLHTLDLDKYIRLATALARKPMGLINLLDSQNQFILSEVGLPDLRDGRMDRCDSFCKYTSLCQKGKIFHIEDAEQDSRVKDLPVVTGFPGIRWYAGTPLVTSAGETIGAICLLDTKPGGELSSQEQEGLLDIAKCIMEELDLREDCNIATSSQKQFLTSISHEIRNPLHGISMCAELLASSETFSTIGQTSFQTMRTCVTSLSEVLDHILTVSQHASARKIKANRVPQDRIPCNLVETLENNIDSTWSASSEYNDNRTDVKVELDIDPQLLGRKFLLYRGEFARVVLNLFSNAMKYTSQGKIAVSLEMGPATNTSFQNGNKDTTVVLKLTDTGCGIAESALSEVQLPFYQSEPSNAGTGLGLYLVRCIVEDYKGELKIESALEEGTTVTATFCLEEDTTPAVTSPSNGSSLEIDYKDLRFVRYAVATSSTLAKELEGLTKIFGLTASSASYADVIIASDIHDIQTYPLTRGHVLILDTPSGSLPAAKYSSYECLHSPVGPLKLARAILRAAGSSPTDVVENAEEMVNTLRDLDLASSQSFESSGAAEAPPSAANLLLRPPSASPAVSEEPKKGLCLVVDDNVVNVRILRTFLARRGFECVSAYDGTDAVEAVMSERERHFDFILMDLNMKKMSGIEASLKIMDFQESRRLKKSTIIAISGCSDAEAEYALSCGIDHFFSKPVKLPVFAKFLEEKAEKAGNH